MARATSKKPSSGLTLTAREREAWSSVAAVMTARVPRLNLRAAAGLSLSVLVSSASLGCERSSDVAQKGARASDRTYLSACARCHGSDGLGGVASPEGSRPPQNFHELAFQTSRSDEQLKNVIRNGKGGMPAFGNLFSDAELQALVHQIRSFDPSSKKP